jgi:hypothetical protein
MTAARHVMVVMQVDTTPVAIAKLMENAQLNELL